MQIPRRFGGHSEDNNWISLTAGITQGGAPLSYLRGIYDGVDPAPDVSSEAGIEAFWRIQPSSPLIYDDCRRTFVAPNARGILEIRATDLKGLRVHCKELYDLRFDEATLASGVVRADVPEFLVAAANVIQYNPVGRDGRATVDVIVQ